LFPLADQTEIINQSVEAVTELIQVYIDRVAEFINQHPSMESLRTFHANTMDKFNTYSDIAYNKVSGMSSAALSGSQNYINGRLATVVSSETLQEVGSTLMNKLQFYYQYYDVADHAKMFMQHSKNVAAEYLNDYLTHSIDHILNDFKVQYLSFTIHTYMKSDTAVCPDVLICCYSVCIHRPFLMSRCSLITVGCL